MFQVPLSQVPNQSIAFNADGAYWQVHIYQSINFMCADIVRNGANVINGVRCFAGIALMPYSYMFSPNFGNLIFDSDVDWNNFASTCNLYYLNSEEFEEYQATSQLGVTT